MHAHNEQEKFWAGEFGSQYTMRNDNPTLLISNIALFTKILSHTGRIQSAIEFGANRGLNLEALRSICPALNLTAVEINAEAIKELKDKPWIEAYHQSILEFVPETQYDLAFVKGVLIHINPEELHKVYKLLYQSSHRYILLAEYYNPSPVAIEYRGHTNKLFKRDFCGELLDLYPNLKLVDYGFCYHRDQNFPQDDLTWFLLEKR